MLDLDPQAQSLLTLGIHTHLRICTFYHVLLPCFAFMFYSYTSDHVDPLLLALQSCDVSLQPCLVREGSQANYAVIVLYQTLVQLLLRLAQTQEGV